MLTIASADQSKDWVKPMSPVVVWIRPVPDDMVIPPEESLTIFPPDILPPDWVLSSQSWTSS
ncbi:hypothetical protein ES708_15637 [subsurface metagenome]